MTSSRKVRIDGPDEGDGIAVHLDSDGLAYLLPSSVRRLPVATRRLLHDLAQIGAQVRHLEDHAEQLVPQLRHGGSSWAQIGAALGITGEGARSRYADLVEDA